MKYAYNFTHEELNMLRNVFTAAKFGMNVLESQFYNNWRDKDSCPVEAAQALSKELDELHNSEKE